MVFSLGKIFLSEEEIISFERNNAPRHARIVTNDVTLQYKLHHFQMLEKPKMANLINLIYILMYL